MMLRGQPSCSPRRAATVLALLLLLGLVLGGVPAFADGPPTGTPDRQIEALLAAKEQRTPAQRKVSSQLLNTASNSQLAEAAGSRQPPEAEGSRQPRGTVASARQQAVGPDSVAELELVTVDIRANVTATVLARIRALGGTVINSVPEFRAIRAQLPLTAVEPLAALRAVQFIRPADEAVTRKDNTSEGDAAHRANLARATHGVTGAGIGIGVLSSGVSTLADRQESGDLPARVTVLPGQEGSGDEGTALLEIVHDIAPGAELYFATGYTGQAQFAANIEALCEAGANVIIDDIGYYREANLQDDIVARGVNAATDNGCYFFSAAGNDGNLNDGTSGVWEGDYAAGTSLIVGGETVGVRHDFGGGQEENPIEGSFYGTVVLQWADPLGASTNDYDLFLVDSDGNVVASSTDTQDGAQDPIESISSGFFAYSDARLVVVKVSGADRYLRLQVFGRQLEIATAGNTWGHSAAENALGVGQVDVGTAGGADGDFNGTESVRTTSSDGPRRVFFQPDGAPITAGDSTTGGGQKFQELSKPDLAAAGCVSTATPGFSRFCGTSAAAPHAAAIAALMLDAAGGPVHVTLAELRAAMAGAALDIEATGVDRDSGAGIVMAPGAVTAVAIAQADRNGAPTVTGILANRTLTAGSDAVTIDLTSTFTDPGSDTLTYTAVSSDPDRLGVTLTGFQVTLTPGSPGPAVVRARATDPGGLSATETFSVTVTVGNRDYDVDNDGLIEIDTLAQLDAVRYDLNGNGLVDGATWRPYYADGAFPMGALEMGCPDGCVGYELSMDLDFDTDGSGAADTGDTYWNAGAGWAPIGSEDSPFTASFTGNGHTLANLFINRPTEDGIGLFGEVQSPVTGRGVIWNVGLIKVDVTGRDAVGSLFGRTRYGIVTGSYATGRVAGGDQVGGLVGESWGNLIDTYAAVHVSGDEAVGGLVGHHLINRITTSYATGRVSGAYAVGGLAGATSDFAQLIQASYATGDVSGQGARLSPSDSGFIVCGYLGRASSETSSGGGIGGLAGSSCGIIEASYATGTVSGDVAVGGLVGSGVYVRAPRSYWDMETSGLRVGVGADDTNDNGVIDGTELQRVGVAGLATAALQAPTGYEGIYGRWNVDLGGRRFGDGEADEPWDFGTSTQYPVLSVDLSGDDTETWREFGYQFRTRFSLSATTADGQAQVNLSWDAADVSPWKPAPSVTYTVYRDDGSTAAAVAEHLTGTVYADTDVTTGDRYTYWVAAVIAGGEVVRSTAAPVTAGAGNQPPLATGTLADVTLLLGADAVTVDVAGAFRDPDDDTLTHTAATSDASVATVSVLGSPVTITPVGAGRAIVTATSTDAVGSNPSATQRFRVTVGNDYDTDDDRLIEIRTLAQFDAMRHNLNGQSVPDDDAFALAFPESIDHWGCGFDGCSGYELEADLDFDTDGSGGAGAGDTYWNGGAGWAPIGVSEFRSFGAFNTTFDGNDHVIANLFVRGADQAGLFGGLGQSGVIRNLSVIDVDVVGVDSVGGLVGTNFGAVIASETTGKVSGDDGVGGLVGENDGTITRSRSFATATPAPQPPPCSPSPCVILSYDVPGIGGLVGTNFGAITSSYATGAVDGYPAGGLTGYNNGAIISSYATGPVTGTTVGGLVGRNGRRPGRISASYATGSVSGGLDVGGLVGTNVGRIHSSYATGPQSRRSSYGGGLVGNGGHLVGASYWDSTTSGISSSRDRGNTTAELQAPDGYNGLYASWNLDLYGDSARDDPWDFGTTTQYPALSVDFDGDGQATWQEFGHQLRAGPGLEVEAEQGQAVLAWTAVDSGHWTPTPGITYNIYRSKDSTVATLVENLDALEYTDPDVTDGPYIYQVAAVADGGQATHSARVAASSAPDLMVESPSVTDSTPDTGGSLTLSATVNNGGDGSSATTTLRYYRSTDATITTSDTSVGTDAVGALAAGATSSETIGLTAPATAGTYYYGACVDAVTNESDTANNCSAAVRVTVVAPPDLVVDPPTVSASSPVAGSLFTLRATVRNRGSGATLVFLTLSYYSSTDDTISTSDTLEGTDAVAALAAGASSAESIRLFAPAAAGTYYYGACVSKLTNESDTTNNCSAAVAITVESAIVPDLVVGTPTVSPSSPLTGASFTLSATVRNQGSAAAGSTTLRYYRSSDSTISTSDTSVGTDPVSSLGAGYTSDESISVTAPATAGTYYYGACVGTVTNESDTTNNCSTVVRVTVVGPPDLVVGTPTVSDSSLLTGASFTLRARVRNNGGSAAAGTTLRYYRSTDGAITTGDTSVGTDAVSGLGAGASSPESISVTAPATAGTYYYGACVGTVTNESDRTNNCSTAVRVTVVNPPDLVVDPPTVSDSNPTAGTSFTLFATVRNSGGSAAGATTLRYYRSSDASITTSDTLQGTDAVPSLGAGNTSAELISLTAPDTAGTYYYGACVGTVTNESDRTNNCSVAVAATVGAAPAPDLVVDAPTVSDSSPLTGASFTLSATVRNQGSAAADNSILRYYRSSDASISASDTSVGTDPVDGLGAGVSRGESISVTAPASAGTYYYGACVGTVTNESDTTNNCSAAVTVTVGAAPVFSEGASTDRSVVENSAAGTDVGPAVTATDADNDTLTYSLEGTDAASFSIVSTSGQIQTSADLDHETRSSYSVTVRVDDGKGGRDTIGVTISVTDENEPPTVNGQDELTLSENDEDFSESYSASDPDEVASTLTWSVTGTDGGDFNIDRSTGELTFRNTPNYESPADSNRNNEYMVTVRATDEGGLSGSLDVTVTVENVDELPTITGDQSPSFPENSLRPVATYRANDPEGGTITWGLSGTDSDDFNIDGGVLTFVNIPDFENPTDSDEDNEYLVTVEARDEGFNTGTLDVTVTVTNSTGAEEPTITTTSAPASYRENGTGVVHTFRARDPQGRPVSWTVTGTDSHAFEISSGGVLTFRNPPDFERPADDNGDNVYELTVVVTDDQGLTDSFDFTVTVTNHHENQEPAITTRPGSGLTYQELNYQENRTSTVHTYSARNYGAGSITWSLSGTDDGFFDISELGALTFKSAPNHEAPRDSGGDNDYEIAVVASNSGGYSDRLNVVITVTDVNEGPEIARIGSAPGSVPENHDPLQMLARYTATDPEGVTVSRWRTSGTDGGDFVINEQGELRFRNTPDYERPADSNRDNSYVFTVQVSDGRNYGSFDETVTVTPVNEPPVITTTSGSATGLRQEENRASRLYTYRATDPERSTVTWSVGGVDRNFFTIDERGQFSFMEDSPPNFEQPGDSGGDNVYEVTIQAKDDEESNTAALPVTVTVRDVNEPPEISGRQAFSFPENQSTDRVLASYSATDPEAPTAEITRWSLSGTDGGDFVISEQGELTFRNVPDHERPADSARDNVYNFSVRASDGRLYGYLPVTVTVTDVNEPPTITTTSRTDFTVRENGAEAIHTFRATDPEQVEITWSLSGADGNLFAIYEGNVTFKNFANFEEPGDSGENNVYEVTVQARDDIRNIDTLSINVSVSDVDEPPEITGQQNLSFAENHATDRVLATYNAIDPENPFQDITRWSLSGADGGDFNINEQGELRFRNTPDYESPADSGRDNVYSFSVRASDGRLYGNLPVTVTVTDVNEPPIITTVSSSAMALRQDENRTSRLYTYRATDPERRTITWSVVGVDRNHFTIDEQGQFSFSETGPPNFELPSDSGGDNVYDVTVQVTDDNSGTDSLPVTVTVRDVNEPPDVSGQRSLSFAENQSTDFVLATYSAIDPENPTAEITRWSLSGTDGGDFTIDEQGELRFRNIPDYERPADSGRDNVYSFSVRASDGRLYGYLPVTVTVTDVNEPPTITTVSSSAIELRQDENRTSRLYTYRATDPERRTITWSVVGADRNLFTIDGQGQFSFSETSPPNFEQPSDSGGDNVYDVTIQVADDIGGTDSLPVTVTVRDVNEPPDVIGQQGLSFAENHATDRVLATYSATDPEDPTAQITRWSTSGTDGGDFTINEHGELRFRNVPDYERPADSGRDNVYSFSVRASDGRLHGYLPVTITVTDVNEPPTITTVSGSATSLRQDENRTSRLYTYRATDPERSTITWSVVGVDRNFFTIDEQGQFSFSEASPPNFEQPSDSGVDNVYDVTVQVTDDGPNTASLPVTVTVRDVNEPPEVSGQQGLTFAENHATDRVLATYSAIDPEDPAAQITRWSTSGTDGGDFTIDESGQLRFRNVPDHERPADSGRDNVYNFSVRASDGRNYGHLPVTVTVTDVNEPPVITTTSRTDFTVRENVTATIYTFRATDPEGGTIEWSTAGADGNDFMIEDGALRFAGPPNFEQPQGSGSDSNQYLVTTRARDAALNSGTLDVVVTVSDVNEGPEISRAGSAPGSVPENHDPSLVLASYTATDPEGGAVSRWRTSGTDGGDFTINEDGELTFRNVPDYERPADSNRDNTYFFTVQVSDGRVYGSFEETVTVADVNEPPTITTVSSSAITLRQDENRTSRLYTYRATDPERSAVAWSIGGVDRNLFTIDERGQFSFSETSPPNFEQPGDSGGDNVYDVTVQVTDDGPNTASLPVTVTVRDVNEPPEVSGQQSLSFTENHATDRVLASYNAIDPEDPSAVITRWSLSGTDGGDFTIDEQGQLRFRNIPDYERPADSGRDNIYNFSVRASDGRLYGHLEVTVTVTDVNEPPTITTVSSSAMTLSQDENRTSRLYTYRATDPEQRTITWSVGGVDRNLFTIDEQGQFSFSETSPPNFEQPSDSGGDNVYDVTIEVRDDISSVDSLPVTVTVRDVNEPPDVTGQQGLSFSENQSTDRVLATYSAIDPEDTSAVITRWSTSGTDGGDFTIDESGQLRFRNIPDYERPADSGRDNVYSLSVRASDGRLYGYLPVTITVTDVNEPPVITTVSSSATGLRQDENRTSRLYTYRATDPERRTLTWSVAGVDRNQFTIDEQGQFSFSETTPPNYEQPSDSGGDNVYDVTIQVADDISSVDSLPVTVMVRDVNEPPDVSGQLSLSFAENHATDRVLATYNAIDPENPTAEITRWSTSGTDGGDFTINEQGQLRFRNVPDYERPADSGRDNVYSFSVRASDGRLYGYLPVTVTVTDVNEPPTITTTSRTDFTHRENGAAVIYTFRAADPEQRTMAWSTAGADGIDFAIEDGALTFASPPNFEQPLGSGSDSNRYLVIIEVRDDIRNIDTLSINVTVSDVNEPPEIAGQQALSFSENQATDPVLATYRATDPEAPSAVITRWSLSGTDGGDFTIDEQGQLRFRNIPDYERPADSGRDNVYNLSVRASDGRLYGNLPVTVTVTDVNEPPTITTVSSSATTLRQDENRTSRLYTYRATDPERRTLTWSVGGVDRNLFTIDQQGQFSFSETSPPNFEQPSDSGGDNVYDVTIQVADDISNPASLPVMVTVRDVNEGPEISRTGSAPGSVPENHDPSLVLTRYTATDPEGDTVSRWRTSGTDGGDFVINEQGELRFRNIPDHERPADSGRDNSYVFTVQVSDGRNYGSFAETVTVTPVNEPPEITTTGGSATELRQEENRTSRLYTYRATDPERSTVNWSVGGPDARFFFIDEKGQFSFMEDSPQNYEQPADSGGDNVYDVTIQAKDDISNTDSLLVTVTVRDVNEPPEISGQQALSFAENQSTDRVLATYSAIDPENPTAVITHWSLSGTDGGDFVINELGELRFRNVPDYERPADSGRDNVYSFSVRASDARLHGYLEVTVTVEAVNELALITGADRFGYRENGTDSLHTYRATDPERSSIEWSLSGIDDDDFSIGATTGVLSFAGPPDYESPTDSDTDNVYEVTVVARDDAPNSGTLEITVTVINVTDIRGTAQVGQTLSVDVSDIDAADDLTNAVFTYQWLRSDGSTEIEIAGATDDAYALTHDDEGRSISLRVTFVDDAGNERILTTAPTSAVAPVPNTPATGLPTISGTVQAGGMLAADTSEIVDEDGLTNVIFSHQWLADDVEIQEATSSTYTLSDDDAGRAVRVRVSFTDDNDNEEILYSEATAAAAPRPNSPATGTPTITGAAHVGQTLTADISGIEDTDGLDNAVFSYQWVAGDGSADSDIEGATASTYVVSDLEMGKTIMVRVSFTDNRENMESLTSEPTAEVAGTSVWSATLTVGIDDTNLGYSTSTNVGALSRHEFTLDDSSHSVKLVAIGKDGLLSFGLDRALPTAFTLHVGGLPFVSADASPLLEGDGHTYQWDGGRLGWNVGDEVTLILTTENRPATGLSAIIGTAQTSETLTSTSTGPVLPVPPIWSATLTPATLPDGYGYSYGGPGELTDTSFELDGATHTIEKVVALGWMYIHVDGVLTTDLAFEVNGKRFRLVDASVADHGGETLYTWPDAGMNWNVGESVQMELYRE